MPCRPVKRKRLVVDDVPVENVYLGKREAGDDLCRHHGYIYTHTHTHTNTHTHTHTHTRAAQVVSDPHTAPRTSRRGIAGTLGVLLSGGSTQEGLCERCPRAGEGGLSFSLHLCHTLRSLASTHSAPF